MADQSLAQKTTKAPAPAVVSKFGKAPPQSAPASPGSEIILTIEVAPIQAQKKMKVSLDSTVRHFIDSIVKNYPSVERPEALYLYLKSSGIWLEEQRKISTYLLKNDDVLELKYRGTDVVQLTTLDVYYPRTRATEIVKFYPQTTVFGIIQALEQKKMSLVDSIKLSLNGVVLENRDALLSSYGITERASLEYSDSSSVDDAPRAPPSSSSKPKSQSFIAELRTVQSSDNVKRTGVPIMPVKKETTNNQEPEQNSELLNALKNRRTKVEVGKTQSEASLPTKGTAAPRPTSKSFIASPVPPSNRSSLPTPFTKASSAPPQETKPVEPAKPVEAPKPAQPSAEEELDAELDDVTKLLEEQLRELQEEGLDEVLTVVTDGVKQLERRNTVKGAIPVAPPPPEDEGTKWCKEWKAFETQFHPSQGNFDKSKAIKSLAVLLQKTDASTEVQNRLQTLPADELISMLQQSLAVVSSFG